MKLAPRRFAAALNRKNTGFGIFGFDCRAERPLGLFFLKGQRGYRIIRTGYLEKGMISYETGKNKIIFNPSWRNGME